MDYIDQSIAREITVLVKEMKPVKLKIYERWDTFAPRYGFVNIVPNKITPFSQDCTN